MRKLQRHHVEMAVTLLKRGIFKDIGLPELLEFLTNARNSQGKHSTIGHHPGPSRVQVFHHIVVLQVNN